jgi:hypothetical protein
MTPEWRKVALAAACAFVAGAGMQSCWPKPVPPPVAQWREAVRASEQRALDLGVTLLRMMDSAQEATRRADSAEAQAAVALRQVARAEGRVDALKGQLAATTTVTDSVSLLVTIVAHQDTVIVEQSTVIERQQMAMGRLREAVTLYKDRGDSLHTVVVMQGSLLRQGLAVTPKPCTIFWVSCPSRTTSFLVGAALGVVGTVALTLAP